MRSAREIFLTPFLRGIELLLDRFELTEHLRQLCGLVYFPVFLRSETDARAVGSAALVTAAESGSRSPGRGNELRDGQAGGENLGLQGFDVLVIDQLIVDSGNRVLPDQRFRRHQRAEVTGTRPQVAVRQLKPGPGEGVRELVWILVEAP